MEKCVRASVSRLSARLLCWNPQYMPRQWFRDVGRFDSCSSILTSEIRFFYLVLHFSSCSRSLTISGLFLGIVSSLIPWPQYVDGRLLVVKSDLKQKWKYYSETWPPTRIVGCQIRRHILDVLFGVHVLYSFSDWLPHVRVDWDMIRWNYYQTAVFYTVWVVCIFRMRSTGDLIVQ